MESTGWWLRAIFSKSIFRRGLKYSVSVGAILIAINHGDAILQGDLSLNRLVKMALTLLVPFFVSAFSSISAMEDAASRETREGNTPVT
ncbi:MAG: nitrate/nitrite transporter NrtS [Gemmatimonadota bacterium]|nr:nitrate/nitrite transporter NrtS [Gemmatimonadota bacterium]